MKLTLDKLKIILYYMCVRHSPHPKAHSPAHKHLSYYPALYPHGYKERQEGKKQ